MQDDEAVGRACDYRLRMPKQPPRESARGDGALARALGLVRDLRARCPWDRAQTRESLRPYLVEEVLELDHALGEGETSAIRDELSDLLLHLAFQLVIGEERREFSADDVAAGLEQKMRRRPPHRVTRWSGRSATSCSPSSTWPASSVCSRALRSTGPTANSGTASRRSSAWRTLAASSSMAPVCRRSTVSGTR